ncbi:MAG: hypothetical protein LUC48_09605 [Clostridiales bacterium]|nr:hypothetical protein [Clostridiales bacterium]
MYLAEKDGKQFRVSGVQVAAFRAAGYTITEEATSDGKKPAARKGTTKTTTAKAAK